MIAVTIRSDPLRSSHSPPHLLDDPCRRADQHSVADLGLAAGMAVDRRARAVHSGGQRIDVERLESVARDDIGGSRVDAFGGRGTAITADEPVTTRHSRLPSRR